MPGDFTPPSRFVRAVAFSQSVMQPKTGDDAVLEAFHVLNQFDIPKGAARDREKDEHGNVQADYTLWTAASNLKTKQYNFRTYDNSQIRMVDLSKMNLDGKEITTISMKGAGGDQVGDAGEVGHRALGVSRRMFARSALFAWVSNCVTLESRFFDAEPIRIASFDS